MDTLEYFRLFNIFIAGMALLINSVKAIRFKFFKVMDFDAMMGFNAIMAWCLCYTIAASIAMLNDVETGVWTVIMGLPCVWTLIAGLLGWNREMAETWEHRALRTGSMSTNEMRSLRKWKDNK